MLGKTEAQLDELTGAAQKVIQLDTTLGAAFVAGQVSWDTVRKTMKVDTGFTNVRVSVGMELYIPFFNNTGSGITEGTVLTALGVDATNKVVQGVPADASSLQLSGSIIGMATHDVADQEVGLSTYFGEVHDVDTSLLIAGSPVYLSETAGELTNTRPRHPSTIIIIGTVLEVGVAGTVFLNPIRYLRAPIVKDYHTSTGSISTHNIAGFYDWNATSVTLNQGSLTQTYGTANASRAAHVGIVPMGAGTVDSGQVGLRVTGTQDTETGVQAAAQTAIITDDITTLAGNVMAETSEKFSGTVTYELYVVSGTPTTYSLSFNYGFSKYEDYANTNFTLSAFECLWEGDATDTGMDIIVRHHKATGWTYAASGFIAGNGIICQRSVDQAIANGVASGIEGAYKRVNLNTYIAGAGEEGVLVELVTGTINSIANMDIHMLAHGEDLV